jgi:hypothetical protein
MLSCLAVRAFGLPPRLPLALAAVSPAVVRFLTALLDGTTSDPVARVPCRQGRLVRSAISLGDVGIVVW